jgi:hypothetical protein
MLFSNMTNAIVVSSSPATLLKRGRGPFSVQYTKDLEDALSDQALQILTCLVSFGELD